MEIIAFNDISYIYCGVLTNYRKNKFTKTINQTMSAILAEDDATSVLSVSSILDRDCIDVSIPNSPHPTKEQSKLSHKLKV